MRSHFWEFFGPTATPTARHFVQHLGQFLDKHGLSALESGVIVAPGQALTFCIAEEAASAAIVQALKPAQVLEGGLPDELRQAFEASV